MFLQSGRRLIPSRDVRRLPSGRGARPQVSNIFQGDSVRGDCGERQPGFLSEFLGFIKHNKKWWLTPILVLLLLLIGLVIVSQTPLAPFIYPFF